VGGNGAFESSKINPPPFDPLSLSRTSEFFLEAHGGTCVGPTSRKKRPPSHAGRPAGWVLGEIGPGKFYQTVLVPPSPYPPSTCLNGLSYTCRLLPRSDYFSHATHTASFPHFSTTMAPHPPGDFLFRHHTLPTSFLLNHHTLPYFARPTPPSLGIIYLFRPVHHHSMSC
jgi:hypothetical protein